MDEKEKELLEGIKEEMQYNRRSSDSRKPQSSFSFELNWAVFIIPVLGYAFGFYSLVEKNEDSIRELEKEMEHQIEMLETTNTSKFDNIFTNIAQAKTSADKSSIKFEALKSYMDTLEKDISSNHTYVSSKVLDISSRVSRLEKEVESNHQ
jgi:hypothetical protein